MFIVLFVVTVNAYSQPTDNVVAYFPFNGSAKDFTGNGNDGTVTNAILTTDRLGKANAAYSFNGSSAKISLPNNFLPGSDAFSISLWINPLGNNSSPDNYNIQGLFDLRAQYNTCLIYNEPSNPTNQN